MAAIQDLGFELLNHPSYSPDLAPSDFYLFPKLKDSFQGMKFESDDAVMTAVDEWLERQTIDFFENGIRSLEHRWDKCIRFQGDYVEK